MCVANRVAAQGNAKYPGMFSASGQPPQQREIGPVVNGHYTPRQFFTVLRNKLTANRQQPQTTGGAPSITGG